MFDDMMFHAYDLRTMKSVDPKTLLRRWRWTVTGQVQGVGFRPFVFRAAKNLELTGWVRNDSSGVVVECQGRAPLLRRFEEHLRKHHPGVAALSDVRRQAIETVRDECTFTIESSHAFGAD